MMWTKLISLLFLLLVALAGCGEQGTVEETTKESPPPVSGIDVQADGPPPNYRAMSTQKLLEFLDGDRKQLEFVHAQRREILESPSYSEEEDAGSVDLCNQFIVLLEAEAEATRNELESRGVEINGFRRASE